MRAVLALVTPLNIGRERYEGSAGARKPLNIGYVYVGYFI